MESTLDIALKEARRALEQLYGERLRRVVLYGSQARGDAHPDSDVDLLVVLDGPTALYGEARRLTPLMLDLLDRYGLLFQFTIFDEARFQDHRHPLMVNVHQEGIEI